MKHQQLQQQPLLLLLQMQLLLKVASSMTSVTSLGCGHEATDASASRSRWNSSFVPSWPTFALRSLTQ